MAAIELDVRIRIPKYFVSSDPDDNTSYLSASDSEKDIIFEFQCNSVKRQLTDGVSAIILPSFQGAVVVALPVVRYKIVLTGRFHENTHTAHAVTTATAHIPDFIDIEEMALTWNKGAGVKKDGDITDKDRLVQLQIDYNRSSANAGDWRTYRGLITSASLLREAGRTSGDFMIEFGVLYEPKDDFPKLREWA